MEHTRNEVELVDLTEISLGFHEAKNNQGWDSRDRRPPSVALPKVDSCHILIIVGHYVSELRSKGLAFCLERGTDSRVSGGEAILYSPRILSVIRFDR